MRRRNETRPGAALLALCAQLAVAPIAAQDKPPDAAPAPAAPAGSAGEDAQLARLDALLAELVRIPNEAWQKRLKDIEARADAATKEAAELRARAERSDAQAAALRAQLEQARRLQELLETMRGSGGGAAPAPAAQSTAPPKTAPAGEAAMAAKPANESPAASAPSPKPAPATDASAPADDDGALVNFDDHIAPIFDMHCATCHEPGDASGGLAVTSYARVVQGGGSGRTLVPGEPQGSRLFLLVAHQETPFMPKDDPKLPAAEIETIRRWILHGAPENAATAIANRRQRDAERNKVRAGADADAPIAVVMPESLPALAKHCPERPPAARAVAASPTSPLLAFPGHGQVLLLHEGTLAELGVLEFPFGQVEALCFSRDGARLLAAGGRPARDAGAVLYDVRSGASIGRFTAPADGALAAALAPDGQLVSLGGAQRRVEVFTAAGERAHRVAHDDWVLALDHASDGELLASGDRSGNVVVTQARTGREVHRLTGHAGAVHQVRFSPDAALLASCGADRSIRVWRMRDGRQVLSQNDAAALHAIAWLGKDRVVSAGAGVRPRVWKVDGGSNEALPAIDDWVYGVAVAPGGARGFAVDWRGRLTALDLANRKITASLVPLQIER